MEKIAFYGGSFDPPHIGHLAIADSLTELFGIDRFVLVPAHHAPHKRDRVPTSPFHRYAMLALATADKDRVDVSSMELEAPERPYTVETLSRITAERPAAGVFFVIGADSWQEIATWREWERVLTMVNIIVVTRPEYPLSFEHVSDEARRRIVDLRGGKAFAGDGCALGIYITDAVNIGVSATDIRAKIARGDASWKASVHRSVAEYIEKYGIYN
jgi:nicotinate-nucleotide adenylyltransferase